LHLIFTLVASATAPPAEDLGQLLVWVALPAVLIATLIAARIKWAVLSRPRYRAHRPGIRTFAWVAIADMVAWAVLWPALVAVRIRGVGDMRGLWVVALLMVVALGYVANRYGFGRAFHPEVAGSMRGTLVAELFTILMPVLAVLIGLLILWLLSVVQF
jgi:uncharacterized membrane protein